jgi:hypothetical protein
MDINVRNIVSLIIYYQNENLIKIEGSIKTKQGEPERTFAYYHPDKAIYFSGNIYREDTEIMKNQTYFILNHIGKHQE